MDKSLEFAEQYSRAERIRIALLGTTAGGFLIALEKLWFSPWLHEFSASAQCRTVFGVSGTTVLFYGLFFGLPVLSGLVVACAFGRRGFKILKDGQVPPLREKSLRLTRIRRGSGAKLIGYLHLAAFVPFLALGVWGYAQADGLSKQAQHKAIDCSAIKSFKPKPLRGSA